MTFDELMSTTPVERWRTLPTEAQERIGSKICEWVFAELVAMDDGSDTCEADRDAAQDITDRAFSAVTGIVEAAFPGVLWYWPEGTRFMVWDRFGRVIGEIVEAKPTRSNLTAHSFEAAANPWLAPKLRKPGPVVNGLPAECLPPWVQREIAAGGRWGAVMPEAAEDEAQPLRSAA